MVIVLDAIGFRMFDIVQCPVSNRFVAMPSKSSIDAVACVKKYFVDASVARGLEFFIRIGIIASIFISNPIQMSSQ